MEHNFLRDIGVQWADIRARSLTVKLVGKHTNLLSPKSANVTMRWDGLYTLVNNEGVEFKYTMKIRPTHKWPWPFRLLASWPTVVIEWVELYSTGTNPELLFRLASNGGLPSYLGPRDTYTFKPGALEIKV